MFRQFTRHRRGLWRTSPTNKHKSVDTLLWWNVPNETSSEVCINYSEWYLFFSRFSPDPSCKSSWHATAWMMCFSEYERTLLDCFPCMAFWQSGFSLQQDSFGLAWENPLWLQPNKISKKRPVFLFVFSFYAGLSLTEWACEKTTVKLGGHFMFLADNLCAIKLSWKKYCHFYFPYQALKNK